MSVPRFTCGCGWPSTSLSLPPSIHPSPSIVSHHSVKMSAVFLGMASDLHTNLCFLLLLLLLSSHKHLPPHRLIMTICGSLPPFHLSNAEPRHPISHTGTQEQMESLCFPVRLQRHSSSAYKRDLFLKIEMFSFWNITCHISGVNCFPNSY